MPVTKKRSSIYRQAITQAFYFAWKKPSIWIISFFSALLFTQSIFDVLNKYYNFIQEAGTYHSTLSNIFNLFQFSILSFKVNTLFGIDNLLVVINILLIFGIIFFISSITQGALIKSIYDWKQKNKINFKKSLEAGSRSIVKIIVLNIFIISIITFVEFLTQLSVNFSLHSNNHFTGSTVFIIGLVIFTLLIILFNIIQIYTLNSIIIEKNHLFGAFKKSIQIIKKHWLATIEVIIIQILISIVYSALAMIVIFILVLPAIVLYIFAILRSDPIVLKY